MGAHSSPPKASATTRMRSPLFADIVTISGVILRGSSTLRVCFTSVDESVICGAADGGGGRCAGVTVPDDGALFGLRIAKLDSVSGGGAGICRANCWSISGGLTCAGWGPRMP